MVTRGCVTPGDGRARTKTRQTRKLRGRAFRGRFVVSRRRVDTIVARLYGLFCDSGMGRHGVELCWEGVWAVSSVLHQTVADERARCDTINIDVPLRTPNIHLC